MTCVMSGSMLEVQNVEASAESPLLLHTVRPALMSQHCLGAGDARMMEGFRMMLYKEYLKEVRLFSWE